ncbi:hypothetical protein EBX31_15110 [bacterium]|nr:hypothetical protein [bacterium]
MPLASGAAGLTRALEEAERNRGLCKRMGESGRERAVAKLDLAMSAREYVRIYSNLFKKK